MHAHKQQDERRGVTEIPVSEYFHGNRRIFDKREGRYVIKIFSGDWHVSNQDDMLATILGSCISACIRDPIAGVGGMNHFLLPGGLEDPNSHDATRYGMYAMETLINGILKEGGQKHRLEVKVFGGGNVINNSKRIGSQNAHFVREYLRREGYRIAGADLEGSHPRRLHYYPITGKVMLRHLKRKEDLLVVDEEARYAKEITAAPLEGEIELF